jgi:hypothetical protein
VNDFQSLLDLLKKKQQVGPVNAESMHLGR